MSPEAALARELMKRCSGRFPFAARWHAGTQRRSGRSGCKSQRPPTPEIANRKARGTARPLAEPCEDVSGPETTPSCVEGAAAPTPRDGIAARPPGARFRRSPRISTGLQKRSTSAITVDLVYTPTKSQWARAPPPRRRSSPRRTAPRATGRAHRRSRRPQIAQKTPTSRPCCTP